MQELLHSHPVDEDTTESDEHELDLLVSMLPHQVRRLSYPSC